MRSDVVGLVSQTQHLAHKERAHVHAFNLFFLKLMVWMLHCLPHFSPKKDNASSIIAHNPAIMGFRKMRLVFSTHFDLKKLKKHYVTLFSQSMASKNIKNHSKTHNQLKTKNLLELRFVFLVFLKVKKYLILTPFII